MDACLAVELRGRLQVLIRVTVDVVNVKVLVERELLRVVKFIKFE